MMTRILFAGFGGQGILFAGKQVAKTGMHCEKQVSWLPSYGPEMRGGTCNCSVIVSDTEIGSPLVPFPDILVSLNIQSFDKFESKIRAGGILLADSTLISKKSERTDIASYYIPATSMASDHGLIGFANVIMLGKLIAISNLFDYDTFLNDMLQGIPASKTAVIEKNKKALELGYRFQ